MKPRVGAPSRPAKSKPHDQSQDRSQNTLRENPNTVAKQRVNQSLEPSSLIYRKQKQFWHLCDPVRLIRDTIPWCWDVIPLVSDKQALSQWQVTNKLSSVCKLPFWKSSIISTDLQFVPASKKGYENPVLNGYRFKFNLDRIRDGISYWCCLHKTDSCEVWITTADKQLTSLYLSTPLTYGLLPGYRIDSA